ncbi:uncharacterized protein CC84DRAFT_1213626 [Paraphaeosphaeria sporulosa]|uniref:Uncharacterized protein n=1 Tax=Paraphaeosphaeria sporulosa TaxID=1460663 RepID=A0A177CRX9_9PLEO|nr:uncharacterized protein CC84DRAFT_1213626 [Paraphaeosphaeria sporulosa]OAG10283.1 hypothetical protein CC84DRAFT_1213626 [Paraphaeosphaeria sporulosa]
MGVRGFSTLPTLGVGTASILFSPRPRPPSNPPSPFWTLLACNIGDGSSGVAEEGSNAGADEGRINGMEDTASVESLIDEICELSEFRTFDTATETLGSAATPDTLGRATLGFGDDGIFETADRRLPPFMTGAADRGLLAAAPVDCLIPGEELGSKPRIADGPTERLASMLKLT